MPRGVYPHTHTKPKDYPAEMVAEVRELYGRGLSQTEVGQQLGVSQRVIWRLMQHHGIQARTAVPRDKRGEKNNGWRGTDVGYAGFHRRVQAARGKPDYCAACDKSGPGCYDWANLTGRYEDVTDYVRLCRPCHLKLDKHRRNVTGKRTSPDRSASSLRGGGAACPAI